MEKKTVSSISGVGKIGQLHVKNEIRTLSNTIHKSKLNAPQLLTLNSRAREPVL